MDVTPHRVTALASRVRALLGLRDGEGDASGFAEDAILEHVFGAGGRLGHYASLDYGGARIGTHPRRRFHVDLGCHGWTDPVELVRVEGVHPLVSAAVAGAELRPDLDDLAALASVALLSGFARVVR